MAQTWHPAAGDQQEYAACPLDGVEDSRATIRGQGPEAHQRPARGTCDGRHGMMLTDIDRQKQSDHVNHVNYVSIIIYFYYSFYYIMYNLSYIIYTAVQSVFKVIPG